MRLVSWNILQGGGSRANDIADAFIELQPDILACQEFRAGKSAPTLFAAMDELDLSHRHLPDAGATKNTVMIASRYPITTRVWDVTLDADIAVTANVSVTEEDGSEYELALHTAHLPQKKKQVAYLDTLYKFKLDPNNHELIVGDLNCGIPFEDSDTKSFDNTHIFQAVLGKGWIDSWRSRNPAAREFSWVSSRGNGYRYDHCLTSAAMDSRIDSIRYDHQLRESRISDHSALIIDFK